MKLRTVIGLGLIGGALYAHRRHGGEWTIDSFRDSLDDLREAITRGTREAADRAKETAERARRAADEAAQRVSKRADQAAGAVSEQFGTNGNAR